MTDKEFDEATKRHDGSIDYAESHPGHGYVMSKCLTNGCSSLSSSLLKTGLCMTCYSKAKKMVEVGTTTWEELMALGLTLSIYDDPFTKAFKDAKRSDVPTVSFFNQDDPTQPLYISEGMIPSRIKENK